MRRTIDAHLDTWTALRIDVNTVHEFQGREADVCIYSVTRSNVDNNIGFLRSEALLNVALSRGRDWLVIVGDHTFCRTAKDPNPLRTVLEYIELHPGTCHLKELGR